MIHDETRSYVQITASANVEHVSITYQTTGVDPLVSRHTQVSSTGSTTIAHRGPVKSGNRPHGPSQIYSPSHAMFIATFRSASAGSSGSIRLQIARIRHRSPTKLPKNARRCRQYYGPFSDYLNNNGKH